MVFNKIDAYHPETIAEDDLVTERTEAHFSIQEWEDTWMARTHGDSILFQR